MPSDPFFNPIALQLIQEPATSRQALNDAKRGILPPVPAGAEFPIEEAKTWVQEILKKEYHPPANTPFLAFPQEKGVCDVLRAAYRVDRWEFEIGQTRYVITIKVRGFQPPAGLPDEKAAEEGGKKFIRLGDRIRFNKIGAIGVGSFGRQAIPPATRFDPEWPHWLDALHWWRNAQEIGFLTIKAPGGPTKEVIGPAEELNAKWF